MATLYYWKWCKKGPVGHLSLKVDDGPYISLWPKKEAKIYSLFKVPGQLHRKLEDDVEDEQREADETLKIPKAFINVALIMKWLKEKEKEITYNGLFGNCAQFVWGALEAGGLLHVAAKMWPWDGSFPNPQGPGIVTPYEVFSLVSDIIHGRGLYSAEYLLLMKS